MNIISGQCLRILIRDLAQRNNFCSFSRALAYKSAFSLQNLYPTSNLTIYTPTFVPEDPNVKFSGYIPVEELDITYSRSSGPGGQHVNRTNTKVDLRFNVQSATWLSDEVKTALIEQHKNKLTKDGCLIIKSELTRSQQLNLADALRKLRAMIREVIKVPVEVSPYTAEMKRKQHLKAARQRLFEKRRRSQIKQNKNIDIDF